MESPLGEATPAGAAGDTDARGLADALVDAGRRRREAELDEAQAVAQLAVRYEVDEDDDLHPALRDQGVLVGGDGVPHVSEFLALELAGLLGVSTRRATLYLSDVLNLRYRHPALWDAACEYRMDLDRALRAARHASEYPGEVADEVTRRWLPRQARLSWTGAFGRLDEMLKAACPDVAAAREERQRESRRFWVGRPHDGTSQLFAELDVLDAQYLSATVTQMAHVLAQVEGDEDSLQVRKTRALGVLAHPAYALALQQQALQQPLDIGPDLDRELVEEIESIYRATDTVMPEDAFLRTAPTDEAALPFDATPHGLRRPDAHDSLGHSCGHITEPLDALRPAVDLHIHIPAAGLPDEPVARIEKVGAVTTATLRQLLLDKRVTVRPVVDLPSLPPQDGYRPSSRTRWAAHEVFPTEPFPFSTTNSRGLELDHTTAYQPCGPPGQTGIGNLAPLRSRLHRAKTAGHWHAEQPRPGAITWVSPLGYRYLVEAGETTRLPEP